MGLPTANSRKADFLRNGFVNLGLLAILHLWLNLQFSVDDSAIIVVTLQADRLYIRTCALTKQRAALERCKKASNF